MMAQFVFVTETGSVMVSLGLTLTLITVAIQQGEVHRGGILVSCGWGVGS